MKLDKKDLKNFIYISSLTTLLAIIALLVYLVAGIILIQFITGFKWLLLLASVYYGVIVVLLALLFKKIREDRKNANNNIIK